MAHARTKDTSDTVLAALTCAAALLFCGCAAERAASEANVNAPHPAFPDPKGRGDFWLSETGLYSDIDSKRVAPDLRAFEPAHALWADSADKRRWLRLPAGQQIDTSDMDHWQFPVGTIAFKEFSLAGKRLETRLIARTGDGSRDYWMGAFIWNDAQSDARFAPDGGQDVGGTEHDVPTVKHCFTCHNGDEGRILGFSAVQQAAAPRQLLSDPPDTPFETPGDPTTAAALGYLHANCGHCHNPDGSARPDTDMDLRLAVADRSPESTNTYQTTVGRMLQNFKDSSLTQRVAPGSADQSALLFRMTQRGIKTQMPSLGSEVVDPEGIARVANWIDALSGM
jgi:hypothetical protein